MAITITRGPTPFKPVDLRTSDPRRISDELKRLTDALVAIPWLAGNLLTGVPLSGTTSNVSHGLGRAYVGWWLIDLQASAIVYRDTTSTADVTLYLPLKASASCTCALWVY